MQVLYRYNRCAPSRHGNMIADYRYTAQINNIIIHRDWKKNLLGYAAV